MFIKLQIKAAVSALWNTNGLHWPTLVDPQQTGSGQLDLLDWLKETFGFQACSIYLHFLFLNDNDSSDVVYQRSLFKLFLNRKTVSETRGSI